MQKGFAPILILVGILVIVAVAGGAYFLGKQTTIHQFSLTSDASPAPTGAGNNPVPNGTGETANWKTYTNSEYKFSFRYPYSFYVKDISQIDTYSTVNPIKWLVLIADSQRPIDQAHYPEIDIGFFQKPTNMTLDEWLNIYTTSKDNFNNPDPEDKDKRYWGVKNLNKLIVNDTPAIKFFSSNGASTYQINVLINRGNRVFIVQSVITSLGQIDDKTVSQILSTFKFIP